MSIDNIVIDKIDSMYIKDEGGQIVMNLSYIQENDYKEGKRNESDKDIYSRIEYKL